MQIKTLFGAAGVTFLVLLAGVAKADVLHTVLAAL
jgi:apolipoprotein N-acyltransferase